MGRQELWQECCEETRPGCRKEFCSPGLFSPPTIKGCKRQAVSTKLLSLITVVWPGLQQRFDSLVESRLISGCCRLFSIIYWIWNNFPILCYLHVLLVWAVPFSFSFPAH